MDQPQASCCVCFAFSPLCRKICDPPEAPLIAKLTSVAPEVTWLEDYSICQRCSDQLDQAYGFRCLCLSRDAKVAPKVERFTCYDCGASYDDKQALTEHFRGHTKDAKKFACDSCNKTYSTLKTLKVHLKKCKTSKRRKFSCEACGVEMNYAKDVVQHCVAEHAMDAKVVKPFACLVCPMRFSSSANLIQHRKYHEGSRSHVCSFCGKSYITKSDLTVHEYTHFNRRNYKCEFCSKAFNTNKNLRSHLLVVHTDPSLWKYGCEVCGRRFPLKSGFEQHTKRHTGEKEFGCHICGKAFVSRSELQKHMKYHSMVKPFKCTQCDKAYKEQRLVEIHLARCHGIGEAKVPVKAKTHACHVCPTTFCDRNKLERHLRSHAGLKPFVCGLCEKNFSDKYYLKQHTKSVHGVKQKEELQQDL